MKSHINRAPSLTMQKRMRVAENKINFTQQKNKREIYYIRFQTIFAGIGLFLTATLSMSSIWIGIELNKKS